MQNNRHTFQSWRDHWVKDLSNRPRPTLPEDEGEEEEDKPSKSDSPKFKPPQRRQQVPQVASVHRTAPTPSSVSRRTLQRRDVSERVGARKPAPAPSSPLRPTAGNLFTDEDTELLDDAYEDILNLDEDHIIDAWVTWAENVYLFCFPILESAG
jgi:hypothetical protein